MRKMWLYLLLLCGFGLGVSAAAQVLKGSITGQVTDPSGAVVKNASVTATEVATQSKYTATTNGTGDYNFPFVAPGTYSVTVTMNGFKTYQRDNIIVGANAGSVRVANSYFVVTDGDGNVVASTPKITKQY